MDFVNNPPRGLNALIEALYGQLARQPKRHPHSVVLLTATEPEKTREALTAYEQRLRHERTLARIAHITTEIPDAGVAELLARLKNDLSLRGRGQGWRKQGFPRFETCHAAIEARDACEASGYADEREFADALYDRRVGSSDDIGEVVTGVAAVALNIFSAVLSALAGIVLGRPVRKRLYVFWLRQTARLSWVPKLRGAEEDFVSYIRGSRDLENDDLRDRILVEAFLRDLEWQLRSSIYSVRSRRRRPAVLLMTRPPAHEAEKTFVRKCAEILDEHTWSEGWSRRTPVQVVAAWDPSAELGGVRAKEIGASDHALKDAARALLPARSGPKRRVGSPVVLRVPVTFSEITENPLRHPPSDLRKHWHDYLLPAFTTGTTAILIAAAGLIGPTWMPSGPCSDTWMTPDTHERVGITDGTCLLSADQQLLDVEKKIAAQNQRVQSMVDQDPYHRPYQTVVLFSPLTTSPGDVGENSLDEARGVQLAQADSIKKAKDDPREILVKVLLANSGDRIAAAPQVAERIVQRAQSDRISAVIGISQSRAESHHAVQILSDGMKVPIIGSVTTGDQMLDSSPRYYEIAPRNVREAAVIASFLDYEPILVGPQGEKALTKDAMVVEDPRDEYSQNIADDFRRSFTAPGHQAVTFDYGPPAEGSPIHDPGSIGDTPESSADQLVHDICQTVGNDADVVFYASRAQELPGVLDKIDGESECRGRQLGIVGTDEVTRFIADQTMNPANYSAVHFYNASFSNLTNPSNRVAQDFIGEYRQTYHVVPGDSGAAEADDSFMSAWQAINLAYQQDPTVPPDTVTAKIADGEVDFTGVTGLIAFSDAHDTTRVPSDKPVFVMVEQPSGPAPLLACGGYAEGGEWSTWGSGPQKFPCPRDPSS